MSGVDFVQWLRDQLDEDRAKALAAGRLSGALSGGVPHVGERWRVSGSHSDDGGTYWSVTTASPDLDRIPVVEMVGSGMSGGGAHTEEVAEHIAAHDPARVLREIDAKRQLIREVLAYEANIDGEWGCCHNADDIAAGLCPESQPKDITALCLLASVYSDRPGYREEWRP